MRRFELRAGWVQAPAEVRPDRIPGLFRRLEAFAEPFARSFARPEQRRHAAEYMAGLLSGLERKTGEAIAYLHDQDRQGLQKFVGLVRWDHGPLLDTLARQVGEDLGEPDAVIVLDLHGFPKKGTGSAGVARQGWGQPGKVDNCQVGVFLAYVSGKGHALVDTRLYLPEEWTNDPARRGAAGIPGGLKYRTRHRLALEMLGNAGRRLPHGWVSGDVEMGRPAGFRRALQRRGERYLLAAAPGTLVRDLDAPPPATSGRRRQPTAHFMPMERWIEAIPDDAWTRIEIREGDDISTEVEVVRCRPQSRNGPEEAIIVTRRRREDAVLDYHYYFTNADAGVTLEELARVSGATRRARDGFERAEREAGLADYQVRNWSAWHHHQALSLLAAWFLNREARRGTNPDQVAGPATTQSTSWPSPRAGLG